MADDTQKKPMMTFESDGSLIDSSIAPPKRVVRTYASDLAVLSQKQGVTAAPKPAERVPKPVQLEVTPMTPPVLKQASPKQEPHLPPLMPKREVSLPTEEPVRAYIPPPPPPPDTWTPPEKAPRAVYSVDEEFRVPPQMKAAAYAPIKSYAPIPPQPQGPGMFTRLLMYFFGIKQASAGEGKILTSTIVRKVEPTPAPPPEPTPLPPPPPVIEVAPPAPLPPPPPPLPQEVPIVSSPDEERETVLARLRARVASREGEAPPPVFPTPRPEPSERSIPVYQGPPANLPGAPTEPSIPQPLQTYSGDFARRIDTERASTFAVIAADADRRKSEPARPRTRTGNSGGLLYVIISTVLIVGGSTSLYLAYSYFADNQAVLPNTSPVASLIASDEKVAVRREDGDPYRLFRDAAEKQLPNGSIRVIYFTVATSTVAGDKDIPQSGTSFIQAMRLRGPDLLIRNLRPDSTLGAVGANNEAHPFFILSTGSYERSFAGMLDWESTIQDDLALLYPSYPVADLEPIPEVVSTSTPPTTSTSTPIRPTTTPAGFFRDEVVESYDVRVLRDASGRSLILYGYRDPNTLIIVRDEAAFAAVLTRFTGTSKE